MTSTMKPPTLMLDMPDGTKFKGYEKEAQVLLPKHSYVVVRMDGKNFSTYTKRFAKPYDVNFMEAMDETTRQVCKNIPGVILAYTQSDEISIVFSDLSSEVAQQWLGGKIAKILSISAATTTGHFISTMGIGEDGAVPVFDSRCHTLSDPDEIQEYVRWRRFDAQKNSITMAASALFPHSFLQQVSSKERLALLEGTDYEKLPEGFYNGRVSYRETFEEPGFKVIKQDQETVRIPTTIIRSKWVTEPATREFMEGKFLKLITPIEG